MTIPDEFVGDDTSEPLRERYLSGQAPEWTDEREQVSLHAAIAKFIGCLDDPDLPRSDQAREAVQESLLAQQARRLADASTLTLRCCRMG